MKASEIREGGVYVVKVSNVLCHVRVDAVCNSAASGRTRYGCTNLRTGKKITVRSAQRFRCTGDSLVNRNPPTNDLEQQ